LVPVSLAVGDDPIGERRGAVRHRTRTMPVLPAAATRTGAGVVRRAMVPALTCTNATPLSAPGHGTSIQEPRLRLTSSTVPICAFPTRCSQRSEICEPLPAWLSPSAVCPAGGRLCGYGRCARAERNGQRQNVTSHERPPGCGGTIVSP
jgi:hypothetical protein